MKHLSATAATLVVFVLAMPVFAQTVEQDGAADEYSVATQRAQTVFLDYHKAMRAETDCRQMAFGADDRLAMDRAVAQEMVAESPQISLSAGRLLNLRRMADDQMDHIVSREGCDGQKVKKSLAFYDERLANTHPVPESPLPGPQPVSDQTQAPADMATPAPQSLVPADQP